MRHQPQARGPADRLKALRTELKARGLDGFVVPRAGEFPGEDMPPSAERLAWLTGFTGSAGIAVVLAERAAIFVDGRYTLQVAKQVDTDRFTVKHLIEEPPTDWVKDNLPAGAKLAFDPRLHSVAWVERIRRSVEQAGGTLVAVEDNPIDAIWTDQPPPPLAPIIVHTLELAGQSAAVKRQTVGETLGRQGIDAAVITAPDSVSWLLNLRGGDVPNTPVALAVAILFADGAVDLFCDPRKITTAVRTHLGNEVSIQPEAAFGEALDRLGAGGRAVLADPATANAWVFDRLHRSGAQIHREADPCLLPKACKNGVELRGARNAHARDGVAVCRFLSWLDRTAPQGTVDELSAADHLTALRAGAPEYRGASFATISGAGPNGAVVHYRASEETNRRLEPGSLYLVDSGAQYIDGTTDITRTVPIGTPTEEMRERFTLVLQGHIALASARFPRGTTGPQLDPLARQFLWRRGLDYDHGTGHGIGSYLAVHEGPHRIAKLPNAVALQPGMIVSDEPGYYEAGAYGIRIENLIAVRDAKALAGGRADFLEFEVLTLAPIDRRLIVTEMLTETERRWVDAYHARVREALSPDLGEEDRAWLAAATAPLEG
ncbi:MAG: aminopeptidase P family protein [Rhodospirillaceae bacterium]|nr:aminopeptidase P family protein [Rhodospirillaceae bacterium]